MISTPEKDKKKGRWRKKREKDIEREKLNKSEKVYKSGKFAVYC